MPATGPVTPEGKARSAMNAYAHGLTAKSFKLLPDEDPVEYELLVLRLRAEWAPEGEDELVLVEKLACDHLRLARALGLETALYEDAGLDADRRSLRVATLGRYVRGIERGMAEARKELARLQKARGPVVKRADDPGIVALEQRYAALLGADPPAAPVVPAPPRPPNRAERRRMAAFARQHKAA
ncbi:MAG TPA: hypothetical protein VFG43_16980 [Geminicoccaceae bacterium]|nr:hypothetical protein [Geminicoccaceae bacterium]